MVSAPPAEDTLAIRVPRQFRRIDEDPLQLFTLKPLEDSRWDGFLASHPRASAYHTREWLTALRRTYGYEPIAFTTSAPGEALRNAAVFCGIESWLTGKRLVSLPFSDHCDPLFDSGNEMNSLLTSLEAELQRQHFRYIEIRSTNSLVAPANPEARETYCEHSIDLDGDIDTLFKNCHKSSTQRKIRRAKRERLGYAAGQSPELLESFFRLLLITRRRHRIPPQPRRWFQALIDEFGPALKIRVAYKDALPLAAILTIRHKQTLLYKYGCSDARYHSLGGMQMLLWEAIRDGKQEGLHSLDLGRSEWDNTGLITFKDRWGARRSMLNYIRLLSPEHHSRDFVSDRGDWKQRAAKRFVPYLPDFMLRSAGDLLYRHLG